MKPLLIKIFRWVLRVLSGLIIVFFLFMFIGEAFFSENPGKPISTNDILQLSTMGLGLIGLGLAWKWVLIGGIIALAAFVALVFINTSVIHPSLLYIVPITALLFRLALTAVFCILLKNNYFVNCFIVLDEFLIVRICMKPPVLFTATFINK